MKPDKRTIEEVGGFVVVHAALPPDLLKWAVKRAKDEGHKDVSQVMQRGIDCLRERQKAGLPLA
jgi:hypothetical protein